MTASPHILVVDDHRDIRDLLAKYLKKNGMRVSTADGGRSARQVLQTAAIDLAVLDIMMPGEDGLDLCRHIRESSDMPVIFLTAMAEDTDRVVGLELGADDYVTKPFNPRELLARIKAVLRRAGGTGRPAGDPAPLFLFEGWTLDTARRELIDPHKVTVPISAAEYRLLTTFLERPNMVLSRDQLLDMTAGREAKAFDRAIDNQISRLRKKIEPDAKQPRMIKTVRGGGYVFAVPVDRTGDP